MKRGPAGTEALNAALQDLLNPSTVPNDFGADAPKAAARSGDRVMQLQNDYDIGVFNGDVGVVDDANRNGSFVARFATGGGGDARVMYARPRPTSSESWTTPSPRS